MSDDMTRTGQEATMRVRLTRTTDPHTSLRPGDEGEVRFTDDLGTVHVDWDNGSTLGLLPDVDRWEPLCTRCGQVLVPGCCPTVGDPEWEPGR